MFGGGQKITKFELFYPKKAFHIKRHLRKCIFFQCQDGARGGGSPAVISQTSANSSGLWLLCPHPTLLPPKFHTYQHILKISLKHWNDTFLKITLILEGQVRRVRGHVPLGNIYKNGHQMLPFKEFGVTYCLPLKKWGE